MQINTTLRFLLLPNKMAKTNETTAHAGEDVRKAGHLFITADYVNWFSYYRSQYGHSSENRKSGHIRSSCIAGVTIQ